MLTQKKNRVWIIAILCVTMLVQAFVIGGTQTAWAAKEKKAKKAKASITATIKDNREYDLSNNYIRPWLKTYKMNTLSNLWGDVVERSYPNGVKLAWRTKGTKATVFYVTVSTNPDMSEAVRYKTNLRFIVLDNLFVGTTYYWQVSTAKNRIQSPVYTFRTKSGFRTLRVDGVSNVRDIGGKKAKGGMIRQGMLYRSGRLDRITAAGRKTMVKELKIKTDFDLRKPGEGNCGTGRPLGSKVKYKQLSGLYYSQLWRGTEEQGVGKGTEAERNMIVQEMRVLANAKNYPIDFHCMAGRDRTGTLAFLVEGFLGVSKKTLFKDYDLSFFSIDGHEKQTGITWVDASDIQYRQKRIMKVYDRVMQCGKKGDKLSKKFERYLIDLGVSKKDLRKIKNILIEPED